MSESIDIKTIQAQLDYLKETKSQLKQSLQSKGQVIDDTRPFRDYAENIDKLGSVKMFNSIDEMNADTSSDHETVGLIYEHHLNKPTFESIMTGGISLPRIVKLDKRGFDLAVDLFGLETVKTNGYGYANTFTLVNDTDASLNITCGFTKFTGNGYLQNFYFYMTFNGTTYKYFMDVSEKGTGEETYLATREYPDDTVGIYQLKGSDVGTYTFESNVDTGGNPIVPQVFEFFYWGKIHFHNIYSFDKIQNSWKQAPHQFTATAENVTTQNFFGKNGAEVGNLDAIKYVSNENLYNLSNIHKLYSDLYKSVDTSNVTCITNLGNYLGSLYIDYLVFNNLENCSNAFFNSSKYGVEMGNWNMSKVYNASHMFYRLPNWIALNIYNWNVSNLKDASWMFHNLPKISNFPINKWNTHNIVNARGMFSNNPGITYAEWMNLNLTNLQDASYMFAWCNSMYKANLCNNSYGWHKTANNITTMANMFRGCTALQQVTLCGTQGGIRCNNLTNTSGMFCGCKNLNTYFNSYSSYGNEFSLAFENVTDASEMFSSCTNMYNLSLRNIWNSLENSANMFNNCTNLRDLRASFRNQDLLINAAHMFNNCVNLQNCMVFNNLNFLNLINGANMFAGTKALNRLTQLYTEPSSIYAPNLENASYMFYMCNNARHLSWNMPNLLSGDRMYWGSNGITGIGMTNANLCKLTNFIDIGNSAIRTVSINSGNFNKLFYFYMLNMNNITNIHVVNNVYTPSLHNIGIRNLPNLTNLTLTGFNMANINNVMNFVNNCPNVQIINLAGANFHNVKSLSNMILSCGNLSTLNLAGANFHNVTTMIQSFASLTNMSNLYLNNADFSNVVTMNNTFAATGVKVAPLTGMALPNVTTMVNVYRDCKQLTELNLADTELPKLTSLAAITLGCSNLTSANFINCSTPNLTNMQAIFKGCSNLVNIFINNDFTTNITSLACAFEHCSNLNFEQIDNLDTTNVTTLAWVLTGMVNKETFAVPHWNTDKVTTIHGALYGASNINELDLRNWNIANVTDLGELFGGATNINHINMSGMDTSNVTDLSYFFQYARDINDVDIEGCDFSNVTAVSYMFNNVRNIDLMGKFFSGKTYNNITSLARLCSYSYGININLSDAKMPNLVSRPTFYNVSGLKEFNLDDVYFPNLGSFSGMGTNLRFTNMKFSMRNFSPNTTSSPFPLFNNSIGYIDLMDWSGWNLPNYAGPLVGNNITTFATYGSYPNLNITEMNLSNFNGPNITYIDWSTMMRIPKVINYANANFANATYITFNGGFHLNDLDLTGMYAPNVSNITNMFGYCNNLSDASIQNILNYFLTLDKLPAENKILTNTNTISPFYNTNISSVRFGTRVEELQNAGWIVY